MSNWKLKQIRSRERSLATLESEGQELDTRWLPRADVRETCAAVFVTVELPGVLEEDVVWELRGSVLTIHGRKRADDAFLCVDTVRSEREFGMFSRSFDMPFTTDPSHVIARFQSGLLTIALPKLRAVRKRSTLSQMVKHILGLDGKKARPQSYVTL